MVSTGKEGVIYNGLSDWLYEGEPRAGPDGAGGLLPDQQCWLFSWTSVQLNLQFLKVLLGYKDAVGVRGALGRQGSPRLVARCAEISRTRGPGGRGSRCCPGRFARAELSRAPPQEVGCLVVLGVEARAGEEMRGKAFQGSRAG